MASFLKALLNVTVAFTAGYAVRATLLDLEARERDRGIAAGKKILILGAGFAGIGVAQELIRLLPDADNGEITLVDSVNYLLFTPMLTEAAGGDLDIRHIVSPVRTLGDRVQFVQGLVKSIDAASKRVTVDVGIPGLDSTEKVFEADHLVIALGAVTSYHDLEGVQENSFGMKRLDDAGAVCTRALACLQRATEESDADRRKMLLTFVVGGGGFTGVETMAALNDMVRDMVERFPGLLQGTKLRTLLVHPGKRLLEELTPELAAYAQKKLEERGVEVQLNTKILSAGDGYVEIEREGRVPTRTLVWAAGTAPSPVITAMDVKKGKHGLIVDSACQLPEHPGIWALGDIAEIPNPEDKGTYAPTAQNATREGKQIAQNIVAVLRGEKPRPFRYTPMGELALVGRHTGVARVFGLNFSGTLAWAMWRAVYLAKMPNPGQQARILNDWVLDALFGREAIPLSDTGQVRTTNPPARHNQPASNQPAQAAATT